MSILEKMGYLKRITLAIMALFFLIFSVNATQEQIRVDINEYVDQTVLYDPLETGGGIWADANENQSYYNLTGYINVSNQNPNGRTISDIYVSFIDTGNMTLPTLFSGRNGTFIDSDPASGLLVLHISELAAGEESRWIYSINGSQVRPVLNLTSSYSDSKVLAGTNLTVTDTLQNDFENASYQTDTCIYNVVLNQTALEVNFSSVLYDFLFEPSSIAGSDSTNVTFDLSTNKTLTWNVFGGGCIFKDDVTDISYLVQTPLNIPSTESYPMVNTSLSYTLNQTISHVRVSDITAISEAELSFEKRIVGPSDPLLFGSNVTWNITGFFNTSTNITYNVTSVSFWVSQRNVNGVYTDPNTRDNDSISNATLQINYVPNALINLSQEWRSNQWLFNYSDLPSPIVWMKTNFTIFDDGTQLINRTFTQNGNDFYIKEIYLIIGYFLEIEKNLTALSSDTYNIRIDVHNKGNQVTPADAVVTIYDFIPEDFNYTSFVFSSSPWYTTTTANNTVNGTLNGTLVQWGLLPTNTLNTSFAQGPVENENTTWSVEYNVTGLGDYTLLDVFVTGLDPQQVDGAGTTQTTIVTEVVDRLRSTEGIFAAIASVLLLIGLLL